MQANTREYVEELRALKELEASKGAAGGAAGAACTDVRLEASEAGCLVTQVLEPAALDVLPEREGARLLPGPRGPASYLVGVAGRGTELLRWQPRGSCL